METIAYEPAVRLLSFLGVLVLMALWERVAPRRRLSASKLLRWLSNLGLTAVNSALVRGISTLGAVGVAIESQRQGWGFFNHVAIHPWVSTALSVVVLDLVIYLQHVMFHAIPLLWRLHMVHHADPDVDLTTGLRFHTIEILLSLGVKSLSIILLGAPPLGVLVFEVLLNATSIFNHSNIKMPPRLDSALRLLVVTPDMHRIHHSTIPNETNSNFGFNLPWWDYLLGTYRPQPSNPHETMSLGLSQVDTYRAVRLPWMLVMPFVRNLGSYPINRRRLADDAGDT